MPRAKWADPANPCKGKQPTTLKWKCQDQPRYSRKSKTHAQRAWATQKERSARKRYPHGQNRVAWRQHESKTKQDNTKACVWPPPQVSNAAPGQFLGLNMTFVTSVTNAASPTHLRMSAQSLLSF